MVRLYENSAQSYFKMKNYEQAAQNYQKAIKLDPYRSTLYKGLADIYYLNRDLEAAISLNKRGFMLSPRDYHWPLSISLLYRDKRDIVRAKEYLNQALELQPENIELKNYYQELYK